MYPFNSKKQTTKKDSGTNTNKYIIIHHTAGGNFKSNMDFLSGDKGEVSTHFVIGESEERGKIGDPKDILWHAGESSRGDYINLNKYSLGVEVVGYGAFNQYQFIALTDLVQYLMGTFNIPKENILRHSDITQLRDITKQKILWDGKRTARKTDIGFAFFPEGFEIWREQLYPRTESRYGLHTNVLQSNKK